MSQDNKPSVGAEIKEERYFHKKEEVRRINWWIPEHIYEELREESIGTAGTTHHMGQVVTKAMAAELQNDADNTRHKTWVRLKESHDYSHVSFPVDEWNYRNYVDYSTEKVEMKALNVSLPESIVDDFTRNLDQNKYGVALANALDAELTKRHHIRMMHKFLDQKEGRVTETEVKELDVNGTPVDARDLRMHHTDAEMVLGSNDVDDYKSRRGAVMADIRASYYCLNKSDIYSISERFGVSSRPTKRKDFEAIIDHIKNNEDERFEIYPSYEVSERVGTHNLAHFIEFKRNNVLINDDDYDEYKDTLDIVAYDREYLSRQEVWGDLINALRIPLIACGNTAWNHKDSGSLEHGVAGAIAKKDTLEPLQTVVEVVISILRAEEFDGKDEMLEVVKKMITVINEMLDAKPNDLEEAWESKKKKNRDKHTNKGKRNGELERKDKTMVW